MVKKKKLKKYIFLNIAFLFLLIFTIYIWYNISSGPTTLGNPTNVELIWDGNSVSTSFSGGNGTVENPYKIATGSDFAYFIQVLNSEEANLYQDKNYVLTADIHLGDNQVPAISQFMGSLDGQGHSIKSFHVTSKEEGNISYYGLFTHLSQATIQNINFQAGKISVTDTDKEIQGGLLAGNIEESTLDNITITGTEISELPDTSNVQIGGLTGILGENCTIQNSYFNLDTKMVPALFSSHQGSSILTNIIVDSTYVDQTGKPILSHSVDVSTLSQTGIYYAKKDSETVQFLSYLDDTVYSSDTLLASYNENLSNEEYNWVFENNTFYLKSKKKEVQEQSFAPSTDQITLHESGVYGDTVYVNDLEADWNSYLGNNYTESQDGTLPSGVNQNFYHEGNLVKVQINYDGTEYLQSGQALTGMISLTEQQSNLVYYKVYPVSNNHAENKDDDYVEIELIDNPYADRPDGYAFNGWVSKNPNYEVVLDHDYFVYKISVPVTYDGQQPQDIVLDIAATWTAANVQKIESGWNSAFTHFDDAKMMRASPTRIVRDPLDMTGYFVRESVSFGDYYTGYDQNGNEINNRRCTNFFSGCTYYRKIENEYYDASLTYYELRGSMIEISEDDLDFPTHIEEDERFKGKNTAGFYQLVVVSYQGSLNGYYDENGMLQSGSCNNRNGCSVYDKLPYVDEAGNPTYMVDGVDYYYLVTRDTNILLFNTSISSVWESNATKPFTLTSLDSGVDYRNQATWNINGDNVFCYSDVRIEFVTIQSSTRQNNNVPSSNTSGWFNRAEDTLFGNYHNVKIGRGLRKNGNNQNFHAIIGAGTSSSGSSSQVTKYRLIIESGYYNSLALVNGDDGPTVYTEMKGVYGSDYDRVTNNNSNLDVYYCAAGSFGGNLYASSSTAIMVDLTVKSGTFGSGKYDYTTGIYVGGQQGGTHYAIRKVTYEGGYTYNLIGGPLSASNRANLNDIIMNIKGGSVDLIVGGAGRSATYGNRIIQVTGGTINYSIFGGSNGYSGSSSEGTLNGSTLIYVGGNAVVGSSDYVDNNQTLFNAEAGSVFGIGNGRREYTSVGSADNSNIIIDGNAHIRRNVYGGGNYGATGISSSQNTTNTNIQILDGTIVGSVFGGGNRNGSGSTSKSSTIDIVMSGGDVEGTVYGGSNENGTIYGNVNVNIHGGTVQNDVFGGGKGGYSSSSDGTYVTGNVNVVIGDNTLPITPTISGSVYGGSAYGTVNGSSNTTTVSEYQTKVTVNKGVIHGSVFGGGMGSSNYTPYVEGDVTVTILDGNIGKVFGGNDEAGTPNGDVYVYLNGGIIEEAYGGGNNTGVSTTHIFLNGATSTYLYGGSNRAGLVNTSNVELNSGKASFVFGGNNAGGDAVTTNVTVHDGDYGSIYGGNNEAGSNETSHILVHQGKVENIYGGGNKTQTTTTHIQINDGVITNLYGGGNQAGVDTTNLELLGGSIQAVYGGSNQNGTVDQSNILVNDTREDSVSLDTTYTEKNLKEEEAELIGYKKIVNITATIYNHTDLALTSYQGSIHLPDSVLYQQESNIITASEDGTYLFDQSSIATSIEPGGKYSFSFSVYTNKDSSAIEIENKLTGTTSDSTTHTYDNMNIDRIYGGNNLGGTTNASSIIISSGKIGTIYGGGNEAVTTTTDIQVNGGMIHNLFGGGNQADISGDTTLTVQNATILNSVYGGGNLGNVQGDTHVNVLDSTVRKNVYGGGNQANVIGNATTNISGNTTIGLHLFGGGNAGAIGTEGVDNSETVVNVTGARIGGNVYGGCNTSVVNGIANVHIGSEAVNDDTLKNGDVAITGTVFGGGEANASGSDIYDYDFISVTKEIHIDINGKNYLEEGREFSLSGSVFGSGNASSSKGTSDIYIAHLGTKENPSRNISIQRADTVTIDHSFMEFSGTTDRTNEYSDIKYSFNRIKLLKIKNGTTLLLQQNANLLEELQSLVDVNGKEEKAVVTIDDENKTVTKNVDNRIYLTPNKNLNITTNEAATSYGRVSGMTFLGMYTSYSNGSIRYGLYDSEISYGDSADAGDVIVGGSYVLGLHHLDHDITVDGFYSNYIDEDYTEVTMAFIEPIPPDTNFYRWTIGIQAINYSLTLTASKYSSLGTYELGMLDFAEGNTTFEVIGFNSEGLTDGVQLVDSNDVPKVAATPEEANSILGLSMKSETQEWTGYGTTKFLSIENGTYTGTKEYKTDHVSQAPSLMFYLYHAKNISLDQDLGTVVITMQALTPINEIESEVQLITISIDLSASSYNDGNYYDASITYDKKYEMPSATVVNITNKSQFTTYYSLYAPANSLYDFYGKNNDYYHTLTSSFAFPEGTQITMIDYGVADGNPEYYYYTVTQEDYIQALEEIANDNEAVYPLSRFVKMASLSPDNTYQDSLMNQEYYHDEYKLVMEEFVFIFDLKNTSLTGDYLDNSILLELRNQEDRTMINVLGIRQNLMKYSLFEVSNLALTGDVSLEDNNLYHNHESELDLNTVVSYDQTANRESIIDTNYESSSMGINIRLFDSTNEMVSSSLLLGTTIKLEDEVYSADSDGVFRIKLADKISNLMLSMKVYVGNQLPPGDYKMQVTLFASTDGLHNDSELAADVMELTVKVVGDDHSIIVDSDQDEMKIVDGTTGLNQIGTNQALYHVQYASELEQPNIRISVYKRDTDSPTSTSYSEVDAKTLFSNTFTFPEALDYTSQTEFEYIIMDLPTGDFDYSLNFKDQVVSGTYRISFKLYDNNHLVDEDNEYIIVKK